MVCASSRFLFLEAEGAASWLRFRDVSELGVRMPDLGREASDDGSGREELIDAWEQYPPCTYTVSLHMKKALKIKYKNRSGAIGLGLRADSRGSLWMQFHGSGALQY